MSEGSRAGIQENPEVRVLPVVAAIGGALGIIALVLAILVFLFWIKLGTLPTSMPVLGISRLPEPRLQAFPHAELEAVEKAGRRELHEDAVVPIDKAMAIVARRSDPYAPLLSRDAVPDSPGLRAMTAAMAGPTAPRGAPLTPDRGKSVGPDDRVAPPAGDRATPRAPGLGREPRVPSETIRGTPRYVPPEGENGTELQ
ncbi:hypothetical protein [Aurantimonas sp. VKM B-3413]|uniref:hypothetical protein n=1 Tax=Aurantimonas sp. VKM B-3413 TaxID=2779401 RepID=UPI001E5830EE|nr:hypothetical protein [Aurantimonas sp. VKM B-3413]MCB8839664.1 hypothetical protein [Aurantimonas sp. VKM B-3413]